MGIKFADYRVLMERTGQECGMRNAGMGGGERARVSPRASAGPEQRRLPLSLIPSIPTLQLRQFRAQLLYQMLQLGHAFR
jgi:hypothetical protein